VHNISNKHTLSLSSQ